MKIPFDVHTLERHVLTKFHNELGFCYLAYKSNFQEDSSVQSLEVPSNTGITTTTPKYGTQAIISKMSLQASM